jgi:hypothetical protein
VCQSERQALSTLLLLLLLLLLLHSCHNQDKTISL